MRALVAVAMMAGCASSGPDFGLYNEYIGPGRLTDQSVDLAGVDVLLEINTKVKCVNNEPVAICVAADRQWCGATPCLTGSYVNAVLNFRDGDLPTGPMRAYITGGFAECFGIWITAIK